MRKMPLHLLFSSLLTEKFRRKRGEEESRGLRINFLREIASVALKISGYQFDCSWGKKFYRWDDGVGRMFRKSEEGFWRWLAPGVWPLLWHMMNLKTRRHYQTNVFGNSMITRYIAELRLWPMIKENQVGDDMWEIGKVRFFRWCKHQSTQASGSRVEKEDCRMSFYSLQLVVLHNQGLPLLSLTSLLRCFAM